MSEFSKDELVAPDWLDKSFFERTLRSYEHDVTIEVKNFEITPGTKPGEHYASVMFKINVNYSSKKYRFDNKNIKLIMKTYPTGEGFKNEILANSPAFKSEVRMYTKVLPAMERALENCGDSTKFSPKLIYQNLDTEKLPVIVFEDISPDGFETFDGMGVNDMQVISVILKKLAKFHAASMYLQQNGEKLEELDRNFFKDQLSEKDGNIRQMFGKSFNNFVKNLKTWGDDCELLHDKMNGNIDKYFDKCVEVYSRDTHFKVLCHGDFHSKNLMQRNGCFKDEDLVFVDHQIPIWATPAIDLYYLINIVAHTDLAETHRNDFILIYYLELSSTLRKLGFRGKTPTLLDLHIELIKGQTLEFFLSTLILSPRFVDISKFDMDEFAKNPDMMQDVALICYNNPIFREFMKKNLTRHLYAGSMD